MGQKLSSQPNAPLIWILRGQPKMHPNPEQPIKFQYKTRRKLATNNKADYNFPPTESPIGVDSEEGEHLQTLKSTSSLSITNNDTRRRSRKKQNGRLDVFALSAGCTALERDTFGYDIEDIDQFLARASLDHPANIPVVLSVPAVLYQTRVGGYQAEISLPLGMVVNAVFRNQRWLYTQTPHGEEGYVAYAACIPLGIIPSGDDTLSPCWETSTDVFPPPSGNLTDTEKLSTRSEGSGGARRRKTRCRNRARSHGHGHPSKHKRRHVVDTKGIEGGGGEVCDESSVDRLYLRAASTSGSMRRRTLLVVDEDYARQGAQTLTISVRKGDVVTLLSTHLKGWFWVRRSQGEEGFIPASVAGYGYL